MKKAISVFLSVILVVCSISVVFTLNASADVPGNLFNNGDFESQTTWSAGNGHAAGNNISGPAAFTGAVATPAGATNGTIVPGARFTEWFRATGGNALKNDGIITEGTNRVARVTQTLYQGISLENGKTYQLSFKARASTVEYIAKATATGLTNDAAISAANDLSIGFYDATQVGIAGGASGYYPFLGAVNGGTVTDASGNPVDGYSIGTAAVGGLGSYPTAFINTRVPQIDTTDYYTYTINFTVNSPRLTAGDKFGVRFGTAATFYTYYDDISIREFLPVSATAAIGGTATSSKTAVAPGEQVTFTAIPDDGYTFGGWYKDGVLYNTNAIFTEVITAATAYEAHFEFDPFSERIYNGDFSIPTGFDTQDNIPNRFPSPLYSTATNWDSPAEYHKWFRASVGNATQYSAIITDPDDASNKIAKVCQTALQGVAMDEADIYEITFSAKSDHPYQKFTVSFADLTNAVTSPAHPISYPITSVTGTKTYDNGGTLVTENFAPYDAATTSIVMPLETTKWVTYKFVVTLDAPANQNVMSALRFGCTDYVAGVAYYLDDVSMKKIIPPPPSEDPIDIDADTAPGKVVNNGSANVIVTEADTTEADPSFLGDKVYSVTTTADYNSAWTDDYIYLKADKQYDLSFWFKVADDHPILTTEETNYKYMTFLLRTQMGGSTNITTEGTALVSSLTRENVDGQKIITKPGETTSVLLNNLQVKNAEGNAIWQKITVSFKPTADTTACLAIRPNATGTVYIDQIKLTSAENAVDDVQAALSEVGCAIRTSGTQALRFKTSIDKSAIENLYFGTYELVEYGSVAIKTAYLNGQELVEGSYTQTDGVTVKNSAKGVAYIKGEKNIVFADTGTAIHYTAALVGIAQSNFNTSYSVRAYAVLARPDGSTFTVYDDTTRNATIYGIANLAYNAPGSNDGYAETAAVRNYLFTNIIDKADFVTYPGDGFKPVN